MFGEPTGNIREGQRCRYFNTELQFEDTECCNKRIEKCSWCKMDEKQREATAFFWLAFLMGYSDKKKDDNK